VDNNRSGGSVNSKEIPLGGFTPNRRVNAAKKFQEWDLETVVGKAALGDGNVKILF
jgi:hypothetical protein